MRKFNAKNISVFLVAAVTTILFLSSTQTFSQTSRKDGDKLENERRNKFYSQMREGAGTEIKYPKNQNAEEVQNGVDSLADFIQARSGFEISKWQDRIAELEQKNTADNSSLISSGELSNILSEVAVNRFTRLTDKEIEQIAETMSEDKNYVLLRADGRGSVQKSEFVKELKNARAKADKKSNKLKNKMSLFLKSEINKRLSVYSKAVPEYYGKSQTAGLTPIQAVLLTYSVISDDWLQDSTSNLEKIEAEFKEKSGVTNKPKPFGENGSRFSSPLNILLDDGAINDLLNAIEKMINK